MPGRRGAAAMMLLVIASGVLYYPTLVWLYERYTAPESYYSHGFLIPLIAGWMIAQRRHELQRIPARPSFAGLWLAAGALSVHALSVLAGVHFVSGFSLLALVFGSALFLYGGRRISLVLFPLLFLVFMLPLPLVAVNAVSFPLRLYATKVSVFLLHAAGLDIAREGFRIMMPGDSLVVGSPCSGLRSLISMLALGSVFAYYTKGRPFRRAAVPAAAVPIALASNIVRIVVLSAGAYLYGSRAVSGTLHDVTGYLVFVLAFAALWTVWRRLQ